MLETARGGILLRGLAYESNDVGVFLNVSADHLSLQGVETLDSLAEVKGVVVRATRPDGLVVLNADDPLVLGYKNRVRAPVLLLSRNPDSDVIVSHTAGGGMAIVSDHDRLVLIQGQSVQPLIAVEHIPIAYGGAAPFMVENAMAAAGAAIGLGLNVDQIVDGLESFRSDSSSNKGRLNVFEVDGRTIVIDYAHNDTGLAGLAGSAGQSQSIRRGSTWLSGRPEIAGTRISGHWGNSRDNGRMMCISRIRRVICVGGKWARCRRGCGKDMIDPTVVAF